MAVHDVRITVKCTSSYSRITSTILNLWIVDTSLTIDSRSDKGDSEKRSHVESTTTNTGRKRRRMAGNMAVHVVRITVRCASCYSRITSTILNFWIVDTSFTIDSRSDKEDSENESDVESTTTNTTSSKRKRIAGNNVSNHSKMCI